MEQSMNTGSEGNRAAGYIRSSGKSPEAKISLDGQREEISSWCREHGHELVACYVEETPAAGDSEKGLPALTSLLEDARAGQFDTVVVHSLDRWTRSIGVHRQTLGILQEAHVAFASVREGLDSNTPNGRLSLAIMEGLVQRTKETLRRRRRADEE